ncbi:soluble pyridine nucleotide transhydrogenase [Streptomyces sp. ADI96-02]|uniref:FAD-dependent oxidoreductase n=1 Tax=Streptomyces sp. ADI96-02 TaxID=1522760 RepID=UPI000F555410|nr:FAD-dependent oxidoreductase [Streptomyces sp. ADI96-02]RPK57837.1 soluble pyridine nucleotide transhydrogenase [Streptomyces sp. ADI96-02]
MPSHPDHATVVVGAGPAGLAAALGLARYRHPVTVVDSARPPRNGVSAGVHGHLGTDGATPAEFRARAWRELARYPTVERLEGDAENVCATGSGGFRVALDGGRSIEAGTVLLATGVIDVFPAEVDGFAACWGRSVIHCPYCLGEENAGRRWATVTDSPQLAALSAVAFRAWSEDAIAVCPESMPGLEDARSTARGAGGDVVTGTVRRLHHRQGSLYAVELADGSMLERQTLVWTPRQRQQPFVERVVDELKLTVDDAGFVGVDASRCTNVPGLYAAGDLADRWKQSVTASAAAGAEAADAIHMAALLNAARR